MNSQRSVSWAGLAIGLGLLIIAIVIAYDALTMRISPLHSKVGPHIFPVIIASGMVLISLVVLKLSWFNGHKMMKNADDGPTEWSSLFIIVVGLLLATTFLKTIGFVLSATLIFTVTAFAFGSRRYLRDVVIGLLVAVLTYICFTRGLGLNLPPGVLNGIF